MNTLTFTTTPSGTATSGSAFAQQPAVTAKDANSNLLGAGTAVTLSLTSGTPVFGCTTNPVNTDASGVATFAGCNLTGTVGTYTLTATSGAKTATSGNVVLGSSAATQLVITTSPSSTGNTDTALATQPVVTARDASNNTATSYASTITFTGYSDSGCTASVASSTNSGTPSNSSGVVSFSGVKLLKTNVVAIKATDGTLTSACLNGFTVSPGAVNTLTFTTEPSGTATNGSAFAQQPAVTAKDANSNLLGAGTAVTLSLTSGTPVLACTTNPVNTDASGVATFAGCNLTGTIGTYTLTATSGGKTAVSSSIVVGPSSATQLVITTTPSLTANTDSTLATQPVVTARDGSNNTATAYAGTITFNGYSDSGCTASVASSTNSGTPSNSSGVVSFSGVKLLKTNVIAIKATDGTLTSACLNGFTVSPGALNSLTFTTEPSGSAGAGINFAQSPSVTAWDTNGNHLGSGTSVALTLTSGTPTLSCASTSTVNTSAAGVAAFTGCKLSGTAGSYTLTATSGAKTADSSSISLGGGTETKLAFVTPTTSLTANQCVSYTVKAQDQWNNDTVSVGSYTLNLSDGATGGTFYNAAGCASGTVTSVNLASSTSQQTFWYKNQAASSPTLTVAATGLTSATQAITVSAAGAAKLAFTSSPANAVAGASLSSVVVQVQDTYGNAVAQADTITLSIGNNPGSSTLSGTDSHATDGSGKATFTNLSLNKVGTAYTLSAASTAGYTSATSSGFNISAGAASKLVFAIEPTNSTAGSMIPSFEVKLQDVHGNDVNTGGVTIDLTPSAATLVSGATANTIAGVATFAGSKINVSGSYTIDASSTGLTGATSSSFTVSPAAADATLSTIAATSPVLADGTASSTVTVTLKDQFANVIEGTTPVLSATDTGTTNVYGACSASDASGVSTCTLKSTVEEHKTLTLSSPAISPVNSGADFYGVTMLNTGVCDTGTTTASSCDWGTVTATTTAVFTFKNVSSADVTLGSSLFTITGAPADAAQFSIQTDGCSGNLVAAGATCQVQVNLLTGGLTTGGYNFTANLIYAIPGGSSSTISLTGAVTIP